MNTDREPMRGRFELMMFDLDGTLVETATEIHAAVNDTLCSIDLPEVSRQQVSDWIGYGTRELLAQALADSSGADVADVRASELLARASVAYDGFYQRHCGTRSVLYPSVRDTLVVLHAQGVKLAVVTNKESRYTATVLEAHQLASAFHRVISGDTLPTRKPDPAGILHCLAVFGVRRERALFVGDSSIDVATARNAGVAVWALPYGYNMGQPIDACAPDRVIADLSALMA